MAGAYVAGKDISTRFLRLMCVCVCPRARVAGKDTKCRRLVGDVIFGKSVPAIKLSLEKPLE